jgi:hypothetical protein
MHATTLSLALALALVTTPLQARGQAAESPSRVLHVELGRTLLEQRSARRTAGYALLGWGVANAVGGGLVAGIERDHEAWLAAGLVSASFGVVNALLAPSRMDLSGTRERRILREQRDPLADLTVIRERERTAQLKTAQTFAFNAGLDVFYISAGLLLYALGHVQSPRVAWQQGAGLALATQGLPLLVFDVYNWVAANDRAGAIGGGAAEP